MTRAVVFAYHNVGVRCLRVLIAHGVEVPLVVTHIDSPKENIWFESVAEHATWHGITTITPDDPNCAQVLSQVKAARPDFLFSFYYRQMLGKELLATPASHALNMHGSLLPKYRGRVPVNWAIIHGETLTGATLHVMEEKPDAGPIVDQFAVPILPDDTACEVFDKVTVAAELTLNRCLPSLIRGEAKLRPQLLSEGSYFGGRTAADGEIDWRGGSGAIHNLVRAVAPPYPGAFSQAEGMPLRIFRSLPGGILHSAKPVLRWDQGRVWALCHDGGLQLLHFQLDHDIDTPDRFFKRFGSKSLALGG